MGECRKCSVEKGAGAFVCLVFLVVAQSFLSKTLERLSITFTANAKGKIPREHEFPAIFHVCRLPFAVFSVKRPVLAFINNAVFRSATIISLCLSPGMFYLFSTQTDRAAGIRESELMFGCHLRRRYQPFYKKALKLCRTSRHPKENTFNGN